MKLNIAGCSFWEWYSYVAEHMAVNGYHVPLPDGDTDNAKPSSIEAMFNCNYDANVAANEIAKTKPAPLDLKSAAILTLQLLNSITSERFSKGADRPCRYALARALDRDPSGW